MTIHDVQHPVTIAERLLKEGCDQLDGHILLVRSASQVEKGEPNYQKAVSNFNFNLSLLGVAAEIECGYGFKFPDGTKRLGNGDNDALVAVIHVLPAFTDGFNHRATPNIQKLLRSPQISQAHAEKLVAFILV